MYFIFLTSSTTSSFSSQAAVETVQHERDAQDPLGAVGRDDVGGGHGRAKVLPPDGPGTGNEVGTSSGVFNPGVFWILVCFLLGNRGWKDLT